ncbi:unnamed protein product, partial [Rotaria sordida]
MGNYSKALEFYEKSHKILEKALPSNHPHLASSYNNIGMVYHNMGNYSKALECYEKSLQILEKALPPNHPSLALSYNNIGAVYNNMGDYSKAFEFYEKSHKIREKALPPNHPDLAQSYNNIGGVYNNMSDYSKALEFYEKALKIREKALPPNHPSLATSYNNIGQVYNNMGDYSKALEFYDKALKIDEKALPPNHPNLAISYGNIGQVYKNMGDYSKAFEFYEKSHKIREKVLPPNHPSLATSYDNICGVYKNMGHSSKALEFYEKSLQILEKALPPNHPDLAISYNNIGAVYNNMGDYSKALEFYEKDLEITKKSLPPNHPSLATSYNNIGGVYKNMGNYSKALEFYEKSLQILEKALPPNHPDLATSYNNIGLVYDNMGNYSKALEFYEKALQIFEKALPPNHPSLATSYDNIEFKSSLTSSLSNDIMSSRSMAKWCRSDASSNSSSDSNSSSSNSNSFNFEKIKDFLIYEKSKYQIIENESPSAAEWWRAFGYPAQCMNTQVYNNLSGTKRFKQHADKCFPLSNTTITTSSSSSSFTSSSTPSTQTTLNQMDFTKQVKFTENDITKMKDLSVKWVCGDIRPFSILDDIGCRNLAQECVRLGGVHGIFDINEVLRGEKSISRHVSSFADTSREQIKEILSIPLKEHSLTICPDYWTDSYKKISYLGVTVIIVDNDCHYKTIDLCCKPFEYEKKTAENTLNNKRKKKKAAATAVVYDDTPIFDAEPTTANYNSNENYESSADESESSTDDEYNNTVSLPVKINADQIPQPAKRVLQVLNKCKKVVKYVKKTGINNDIKEQGGVTLHQSCIVRWLSMSNLLESLLRSFKSTKKLLLARKKQSLINDLDETTIKQLILLLKPFKHIMTLIQTGNAPSLYMVLLCTLILKDALTSYKSLINYKKNYCNSTKNNINDDELEEDEEADELEGITWFRERLLKLIDELFVLDVRHYCATMLHPKYRLLKNCTEEERSQCHKYVREQLKIIRDSDSTIDAYKQTAVPPPKKFKTADTLFDRFEDDCPFDTSDEKVQLIDYSSDEYEFNIKQSDELDRYLIMPIDKSSLTNNPLDFWKTQSEKFPLLSKLAKQIHSIPATSTGVERQFSSAGLIINQRRTNINPEQ